MKLAKKRGKLRDKDKALKIMDSWIQLFLKVFLII